MTTYDSTETTGGDARSADDARSVWQTNALVGADRDDMIVELTHADGRAAFWARADQLRRSKAS